MQKLLDRLRQHRTTQKSPGSSALMPAEPEQAFAAEFGRLYALGRMYAHKRLASLWVDDVVQLAFIGMWESCYAKGELPREDPARLFFRILRRRISDQREREENRERLDERHAIDLTHLLEPRLSATRVADGNLLAQRINYLLEALPDNTRAVFRTTQEKDWDLRLAAQELNMPYHTARGHFQRARDHLTRSLSREGYQIPPLMPRGRDDGRRT